MRTAATAIIISAAVGIALTDAARVRAEDDYSTTIFQPRSSPIRVVDMLLKDGWDVFGFQKDPDQQTLKYTLRGAAGEVHVDFSRCNADEICDRLWMWSVVQPDTPTDLAAINRWNGEKSYIFAYQASDGQVGVGFERSLRGGFSPITVTSDFKNLLAAAETARKGLQP